MARNKSKLTLLIEKYTGELNNRKENREREMEHWNDTEMHLEDLAIRKNAEFVNDLKTLRKRK